MKTIATLLFCLVCSSCAVDMDGGEEDVTLEEDISELTGSVVCTGRGSGICTASSLPSQWTITGAMGEQWIEQGSTTVAWYCAGRRNATVTAVGVGSATVYCARLL